MDDNQLTPSETEALGSMARERTPGPFLEERVVRELRRRGLLRTRPRRTIDLSGWRLAAAVAAALVLALGGFALGRWSDSTPSEPPAGQVVEARELSLAASLQQTGSAYVSALERLASQAGPQSEELRQGRQVALATLYTAAGEVTRIVPKDHLAEQFLYVLGEEGQRPAQDESTEEGQHVIWF